MGTGVSPKRIATGNLLLSFRSSIASSGALDSATLHLVQHQHQQFLRVFVCSTCRKQASACVTNPSADELLITEQRNNSLLDFLRKEVIQPHLPIRLPCYDFTPVIRPAFDGSFLSVRSPASGISDSHGVTGGVYKTRERIHRGILIRDY